MLRTAYSAAALLAAALIVFVTGFPSSRSDAPEAPAQAAEPASVDPPARLLEWMAAHRENVGLVVLPDRGRATLRARGESRFPLASTRKVLILGALTDSGRRLEETVPQADVERWYLPGADADAGAHERAELDPRRPTLRQLAVATVEQSDNASADALPSRSSSSRWPPTRSWFAAPGGHARALKDTLRRRTRCCRSLGVRSRWWPFL